MGNYENGGSNAIGVAVNGIWAAAWTVDTPYIDVLRRDFFDLHEAEIRSAAARGESFADSNGKAGAVDAINTSGYLDDKGWPLDHKDPSSYVAACLEVWVQQNGETYGRAVADGYTS